MAAIFLQALWLNSTVYTETMCLECHLVPSSEALSLLALALALRLSRCLWLFSSGYPELSLLASVCPYDLLDLQEILNNLPMTFLQLCFLLITLLGFLAPSARCTTYLCLSIVLSDSVTPTLAFYLLRPYISATYFSLFYHSMACQFIFPLGLSGFQPVSTQVPLLSIRNHCITSLGDMATCSITVWTISALEKPKKECSLFTQRNTLKHRKTHQFAIYWTSNILYYTLYFYRVHLELLPHIENTHVSWSSFVFLKIH